MLGPPGHHRGWQGEGVMLFLEQRSFKIGAVPPGTDRLLGGSLPLTLHAELWGRFLNWNRRS